MLDGINGKLALLLGGKTKEIGRLSAGLPDRDWPSFSRSAGLAEGAVGWVEANAGKADILQGRPAIGHSHRVQ